MTDLQVSLLKVLDSSFVQFRLQLEMIEEAAILRPVTKSIMVELHQIRTAVLLEDMQVAQGDPGEQ